MILDFLTDTFFRSWKNSYYLSNEKFVNYSKLELQVTSSCDQNCSYCYYCRNKILNPPYLAKKSRILKNLDSLLNWLRENNYCPELEIFSGEVLATSLGCEILDRLIDFCSLPNSSKTITIPSNFSFILDEEKTERVESLLNKAKEKGVRVGLSVSIDGKYLDNINRRYVIESWNKKRDDEFYDRIFAFAKKWRFSFHPMIYKNGIELWKDNFLWFQEKFKEFDIPWISLYLLEVRNPEWDLDSIKKFYEFMYFVIQWSIKKLLDLGVPESQLPQATFDLKLFNIFNLFSTCGRGIGCSIQSTMGVRLSDLSVHPCHRLCYPELKNFQFVTNDKGKIVDIEEFNSCLFIAINSSNHENFPFCETCTIKEFCSSGCLGANYEYSGEIFLTPPTVCLLEHAKIGATLEALHDLGVLKYFHRFGRKFESLLVYRKYFSKNKINL